MESKVNVISSSEHEIEVTLSYDEIKPEIEAAYKEERKKITMPGFRKGKVPMQMLKKMYGDAIEYQASEKIANSKFWTVVESENLNPISTPALTDIDFVPGEKLAFKVKYEVKPEMEILDYKNLKIDKPVFKLRDEDVEHEIEHLLKSKASFEETEEITDKKHKIVVDLQRVDSEGNALEGSKNEDFTIDLDAHNINKEIIDSAIGKKVGENFNFSFTDERPSEDDSPKEEFHYDAVVKKIEKLVPPEQTEEFFKSLSNNKATSMNELREMISENFKSYYDSQSENIFINSLLNEIVTKNDFDPPKGYIDFLHKNLLEQEKQEAQRQKRPFDEKTVKEQLKPRAEWSAKWQIISENIARIEKIEVNDDDLRVLAEKDAAQTGLSVEKMLTYYKSSNRSEALLEEKVMDFLKSNNVAVDVDPDEKAKSEKKTKKGK
ncbi:MAG: trigger factor [Melioribacteraceae bacterium]|nr:trigger factor [Melioribacteraceae bacterium]MCF8266403.1 trigger factor [Melioribacteraceae bacterium]MCF8413166.1 trigger factor [Melioribacteraceae bacterium]MCF8431999.1 trigger factor [Melioribacteraceae bacterium]